MYKLSKINTGKAHGTDGIKPRELKIIAKEIRLDQLQHNEHEQK